MRDAHRKRPDRQLITMLVKLVSKEGFEFVVDYQAAPLRSRSPTFIDEEETIHLLDPFSSESVPTASSSSLFWIDHGRVVSSGRRKGRRSAPLEKPQLPQEEEETIHLLDPFSSESVPKRPPAHHHHARAGAGRARVRRPPERPRGRRRGPAGLRRRRRGRRGLRARGAARTPPRAGREGALPRWGGRPAQGPEVQGARGARGGSDRGIRPVPGPARLARRPRRGAFRPSPAPPPVPGPRLPRGVIPEGENRGRVRPASGRGAGMHGVGGCLGRRTGPGTWLSPPIFAPPRPPRPACSLRNHSARPRERGGGGVPGQGEPGARAFGSRMAGSRVVPLTPPLPFRPAPQITNPQRPALRPPAATGESDAPSARVALPARPWSAVPSPFPWKEASSARARTRR